MQHVQDSSEIHNFYSIFLLFSYFIYTEREASFFLSTPSLDPVCQPFHHWFNKKYIFKLSFWLRQTAKNLPVMQETWVLPLGQEGPLEKVMATHCSILAWKISWTEDPGRLQSMVSQRVGHNWMTNSLFHILKQS